MKKSKVMQLTGKLKITAASSDETKRPPKIDIDAYNGGELLLDGFDLPVVIDLAGLTLPPTIPLNVDHQTDIDSTLGQGVPEFVGHSLQVHGEITFTNDNAQTVIDRAAEGFNWQASINAITDLWREIPPGREVEINGRTFTGPIIHAIESQLTHCAVLTEGADQTSSVRIAAKAAKILKGRKMTFEEWVASLGLDAATLTPEARSTLEAAYQAMNLEPVVEGGSKTATAEGGGGDGEDNKDENKDMPTAAQASLARAKLRAKLMDQERKEDAAEIRRRAVIKAKAADHPLIAAKAIEHGWSEDKVELEVMKARTVSGPRHHIPQEESSPLVIEAALCSHGKLKSVEKVFDAKTLEAAHKQYRGCLGIQQLIIEAAMRNGEHVRPGKLRASDLRRVMKAAFSTGDLSTALSNVANKFLEEGYNSSKGIEKAKRLAGRARPVGDFKPATSIRLIDGGEFEIIGKNGKIQQGTLGEEVYTVKAKTRAKLYKITREDQINDDLDFLGQLKEMVGMGASRSFLKVFWMEFLDNAEFFKTGNANYFDGADSVLSSAALSKALKYFRLQKTPQGTDLDLTPAILLAPPSIEATADSLYTSGNNVVAGTTDVKEGDKNIHQGKYEPMIVSQLENPLYTGYSATAWYLVAEPQEGIQMMNTCYLDGQESPTVETADADFDELGIQIRGYWDFGVAKKEPKAAVKSKGAAA